MKTLALLAACLLFPTLAAAQPAVSNFDPRPPTADDIETFLPLICQGATVDSQGGYDCQATTGYPGGGSASLGPSGNVTLTSVMLGHLTDATSQQAYISYSASFESHADNFGGGILFQQGPSGWQLVRWYPGNILDQCLQLNPTGRAQLVCLFGFEGQGEADSSLWLVTVPPAANPNNDYSASQSLILAAQDERNGFNTNYQCGRLKDPRQAIPVSLDKLTRATEPGVIATLQLTFIDPPDAAKFCAAQDLAHAPIRTQTLSLTWQNGKLTLFPNYDFIPPDF